MRDHPESGAEGAPEPGVFPVWLLTEELKGKYAAVHAYDRIIWQIRAGFVTLVGAAWALTLNSVVGESGFLPEAAEIFAVLSTLTVGLAVIAFFIDDSYVKRKFRVITSLNNLMQGLIETWSLSNPQMIRDFWHREEIRGSLAIAGDSALIEPEPGGYRNARRVAYILYPGAAGIFVAIGLLARLVVSG